ncbi:hypothetical protein BC834DRAFT_183651 [Gloeopeniophorella convolvens]|nr:hypothetical protein BC834DRAFT_183651 [Gloeopeniophorella convolvens]
MTFKKLFGRGADDAEALHPHGLQRRGDRKLCRHPLQARQNQAARQVKHVRRPAQRRAANRAQGWAPGHLWLNGGDFGTIFQVKAMLPKAEKELLDNFVSGSVGGFVGTVVNTP